MNIFIVIYKTKSTANNKILNKLYGSFIVSSTRIRVNNTMQFDIFSLVKPQQIKKKDFNSSISEKL